MSDDSNQKTIQAYEGHVQEYIDNTPGEASGVVQEWLDEAVEGLPKTARILEVGSSFGRDALYLKQKGYTVDSTDATNAFVELLKQKGLPARYLNVITDDLGGPYDLVIANAVLLHFTRQETEQVLRKVLAALVPGGRFSFTVKQGQGEEWSDKKLGAPRYFCYWEADQLDKLLKEIGFEAKIEADVPTKRATWLQVTARKP